MRALVLAPLALGSLLLGSACGSTTAPGQTQAASTGAPRQCFSPDRLRNSSYADHSTLYVLTEDRKVYRLDAPLACFPDNQSVTMTIRTQPPTSSLCVGDRPDIGLNGRTCRATVSRELIEEEVAALPSNVRP